MLNLTLVIVLGYYRSGASFLSEFIAAHPNSVYFYEPFEYLETVEPITDVEEKWFYLRDLLLCKFDREENRLVHDYLLENGSRSSITSNFKARSLFFNNQQDDLFEEKWRKEIHLSINRQNMDSARTDDEFKKQYISRLKKRCLSQPIRVIKEIRINLNDIMKFLEIEKSMVKSDSQFPFQALHLVHVIRDPRGMYSSMFKLNNFIHLNPSKMQSDDKKQTPLNLLKLADFFRKSLSFETPLEPSSEEVIGTLPKESIKEMCTAINNDINRAMSVFGINNLHLKSLLNDSSLPKSYLIKYLLIRYEDAAEFPLQMLYTLYQFMGSLKVKDNILRYLHFHTSNPNISPYSTVRISKEAFLSWINDLHFSDIVVIEENCNKLLDVLGYKKVRDVDHMHSPFPLRNLYSYTSFYQNFYVKETPNNGYIEKENVWNKCFYKIS